MSKQRVSLRVAVGLAGILGTLGALVNGCGGSDSKDTTTAVITTNSTGHIVTNVVTAGDSSSGSGSASSSGGGSGSGSSSSSSSPMLLPVTLFSRSMTGHWSGSYHWDTSATDNIGVNLDITQSGDVLTGTWSNSGGAGGSLTGSHSGEHVAMQLNISSLVPGVNLVFDGNCNPMVDDVNGGATAHEGSLTLTGTFDIHR